VPAPAPESKWNWTGYLQREDAMTAYEIMLSESQERMLLVAEKVKEKEIFEVFHKWTRCGHRRVVTADGLLRIKQHGNIMAEIPNKALADEAPLRRPMLSPRKHVNRLDLFSFSMDALRV